MKTILKVLTRCHHPHPSWQKSILIHDLYGHFKAMHTTCWAATGRHTLKSPLLLRERHSPAALAQLREDTWLSPVSLLFLYLSITLPWHFTTTPGRSSTPALKAFPSCGQKASLLAPGMALCFRFLNK